MKYFEMIEKIMAMGLGEYRRTIVPREMDLVVPAEEMPVEKAIIYTDGGMYLSEVCEILKTKSFPPGCYATIVADGDRHFHVTKRGSEKVVLFEGEFYSSPSDLKNMTEDSFLTIGVKEISFCFNKGSFQMMFSQSEW